MTNLDKKIDVVRRKIWFDVVLNLSGLNSAYELNKLFCSDSSQDDPVNSINSSRWSKYKRGLNTPNTKFVNEIEYEYPGSKKWLSLLFWQILKKDDWSEENILYELRTHRSNLTRGLFYRKKRQQKIDFDVSKINPDYIETVLRHGNIESLECLLLLYMLAESYSCDRIKYLLTFNIYRCFTSLFLFGPFDNYYLEIYDLVRCRYQKANKQSVLSYSLSRLKKQFEIEHSGRKALVDAFRLNSDDESLVGFEFNIKQFLDLDFSIDEKRYKQFKLVRSLLHLDEPKKEVQLRKLQMNFYRDLYHQSPNFFHKGIDHSTIYTMKLNRLLYL